MKDRAQEIARDLGTRFAVMVSQAQVLPDPSIPCVAPWSFEGPILAAIRAAMEEARREEQEACFREVGKLGPVEAAADSQYLGWNAAIEAAETAIRARGEGRP